MKSMTVECDLVTFHRFGADFPNRSGMLSVGQPLGEELARVAVHGPDRVEYVPDRDGWISAVAWAEGTPVYQFHALVVPAHSVCSVGPFPLTFSVSAT